MFLHKKKNFYGLFLRQCALVCTLFASKAQQASTSFAFLKLANAVPVAAQGGLLVAPLDKQSSYFIQNPALLDSSTKHEVYLHYMPYFQAGQLTALAFTPQLLHRTWGVGIQYLNYGKLPQTDVLGNIIGEFSANDYVITIGTAQTQGNITFGGNLKWVGSVLGSYQAQALACDIGAYFKHPNKHLSFGITAKNIGLVVKDFSPTSASNMPFDVQLGLAFKPLYMPVRFNINAHHLHIFNILYEENSIANSLINPSFAQQLASHLSVGATLLLSTHFNLMLGYNHLLSQELSMSTAGGLSGFSTGIQVKTKRFSLFYSYGGYHASGNLSSFGINLDFTRF